MITQQDIEDFAEYNNDSKEANMYLFYTLSEMVKEFMEAMGQPVAVKYGSNRELEGLRWLLLKEEYNEVRDADSAAELIKELCDSIYVLLGWGITYGWDMEEAFRRVHASNMSKLGADGKPIKRRDGKVLKGPNYFEPNLSDLVQGSKV